MARIYKESRYVLQLLIGKSYGAQYDDVKISFYTKNPSNQVMVDNDITIKRNIAEVMVDSTLFDNLEEGLIKYIVYGTKDGIPFIEERQSNYFLKTPLDFKPTTCILEDKSVTPSMADRDGNNLIVVEESEGYDGLSRVVINPQTIYNEGVNEQKSKLETINITENGIYSKEDGYNHIEVNVPDLNGSYDEGYAAGEQAGFGTGYNQGQADAGANARVLNVTENGNYLSKFSDPIMPTVTGVYADGTEFHNYAELNGKVFNTKIAGSVDSRLEFWYKGDNTLASDFWNVIIGSGDIDNSDCFQVRYFIDLNNQLSIEVGNSNSLVDNWDDTVWHHLIVSKAEGLWIDGEKKGDFSPSNTINGEFFINGIGYNKDGSRSANGTFGMIKIDNTIIIPTADGFQNVNTGELLEVVKDGVYTFTENLPIYGEGELYKTINVNVPQETVSCNLGETEFEFGISDFNDIFELSSSDEGYDGWSKVTIKFFRGDWVTIYNAGRVFEDYNIGTSPGLGNYGYVCGKITEIQEVNTSAENNYASFTLDNCFKVDKCKWAYWHYNRKEQFESKDQIKVDTCAVVFGVFQDNNGSLQFQEGTGMIVAYQECETIVQSKVIVGETGVKFTNSQITEISPIFEFSNITDYSYMFYNAPNIKTQPISRMVVNGSADYAFYGAQKILLPTFVEINEGASVKYMFGENHAEIYDTINIISKEFPKNIIKGRVNADNIILQILKRGNPYKDFSADEYSSLFVNASLDYIHIKPHREQDLTWLTNGCTVERMTIGEDGISYINPTSGDWNIDNIRYLELKGDYSEYGKYELNGVYYHPRYFFNSLTGIAGCNGLKGNFYFSDKIGIVGLQNFIRNMGTTDVENTWFKLTTATYQQLTGEDISTIKSKGYILYNGDTIV